MKDEKKQIILNEISFWKQNHMLPEQYCDYLLTLYTQGEELPENAAKRISAKRLFAVSLFAALLLTGISLFVLYFTELSFPLQMTILAAFVVSLTAFAIYFSKKGFFLPFLYAAAAVLFLIFTVELHERLWGENAASLYALLFFHCLIWWAAGRKLGQIYFTISAWLGAALLLIFMFV
ncbi:hypothetical protein P4T04_00115 [Bacillus badius]|uniref:hypothetical protein n=1 Tax=Bacillus badius TaxID=1455 RepID=UPI0007B03D81|nr:hypothetical protein [Bacillus badius]KZN98805.1 hypothetical protein A4244_06770 [Bacillus badius]MED0664720.1 hypothetical protein [Bacillus badius]OCS83741.1 hypothetical protein A6M11_06775 [Bacillus badius]OVE52971.1 hypothetical protein B1A98_05100 [Bacillus badius]TDW05008.1 hypothetical protein B0G66_102443 [Bacillus badius]